MENIQYIQYLLMALPAVLGLWAVLLVLSHGKDNFLKLLRNGIRILRRWAVLILVIAVAYAGVYLKIGQMEAAMRASVIIGFNYPEASSGLTPNKTRFNVSEILSDEILENAIEEGNLADVSAEDLKRCLQVTPLNAGDSISINQVYISTEYQLAYEANSNTMHLNPDDVVDAVSEAYCRKFIDECSRKTNIVEMDFSDLENMDYLDIVELFDSKAEDISDYAYAMSGEAAAFQSETTGETFSSIMEKVDTFRDVQLESFQAFILSNGLAKNATQYVAKLEYDNTTTHKSYLKNIATHNVNLAAIERYDRDMATIVLIPTVDLDGEFYMSRTKIGVDYFADDAEQAMNDASKRQRSIQFNNYAITQMQNAVNDSAQIAQAEDMVESLKNEYQVFADLLVDTLADYDKKTVNDYVSVIGVQEDPIKSQLKKAVVFTAIFAVAFCVLIIALNGRKEPAPYTAKGRKERKERKQRRRAGRRAKKSIGNEAGNAAEETEK